MSHDMHVIGMPDPAAMHHRPVLLTNATSATKGISKINCSILALMAEASSAIVCAENISLLFLLHPVPSLPARNTLETQVNATKIYTLSVEEERKLTESLAFLANDSDDVNHIPAVCVEQGSATPSLHVLLAVNRSTWQSGVQSLHRIEQGFRNVFSLLQNVDQCK